MPQVEIRAHRTEVRGLWVAINVILGVVSNGGEDSPEKTDRDGGQEAYGEDGNRYLLIYTPSPTDIHLCDI